jgi:hypothetical protein
MNLNPSVFKYLLLILMFPLVLMSIGINIDIHYCKGEIKSISFLGQAKSCHDIADTNKNSSCPHHQNSNPDGSDEKDCCKNKSHYIQLDQDKLLSNIEIDLKFQEEETSIMAPEKSCWAETIIQVQKFELYKPPPFKIDYQILYQSMLI